MRALLSGWTALLCCAGCAEHQFALNVRSVDPIGVVSEQEPVSRLRDTKPATGGEVPFSDPGVVLGTSPFPYSRDGAWISSVDPIHAAVHGDQVSVSYTLHPGRRDLPLLLTTPRDNVCSLRVRSRLDRALGYAALVVGATVGIFVPITGYAHDSGTRNAAPYLAGVAGALGITGLIWVLWPAGDDSVIVPESCSNLGKPANAP